MQNNDIHLAEKKNKTINLQIKIFDTCTLIVFNKIRKILYKIVLQFKNSLLSMITSELI